MTMLYPKLEGLFAEVWEWMVLGFVLAEVENVRGVEMRLLVLERTSRLPLGEQVE